MRYIPPCQAHDKNRKTCRISWRPRSPPRSSAGSSHLGAERRMSPKTVEAYRRDVLQFLAFLAEHLGGAPSLQELAALDAADVRAFLAARRADGIGSRSLMRALAGMRAFAPFSRTQRQGQGRRARRRARAENRQDLAAAAGGRCRQARRRSRHRAPATGASRGFMRAMPRCWRCSMAAACASPKRWA